MDAPKLFVVRGQCGEYSDRSDWPVAICLTREAADKLESDCSSYVRTNGIGRDDKAFTRSLSYEEREALCTSSPFDPNIQTDYTGTDYYVEEIPLHMSRDDVDAFSDLLIQMIGLRSKVV